ncbi:MAG: FecR domain-containing protein, partial [Halobacteriovoraceae bacterium]|nr:FecR domain-containing protein [Halobacteriovoraceae bacterium]
MVKYRNYYNSKVKTCADLIQKSVDNIILAAAFALLCFSAYYLYFRPFPRNNNLNLPSIAKLSHAQNTVKYRGYDNFSWENAKGGLPLVQGDSVYTHESSGAQIKFKSGPSLSMDPYTLLKITQQDKEFALDLLSGNISAQLDNEGDHITLLLGKRKFRLSGTKAQIKIKKQGNKAQISVLKGQVKISEGEDQKKEFGVSELELTSERGIPKKANVFDIEYEDIPPDYINTYPQNEIKFSFKPPTEHNVGPFKVHVENISSGKIEKFTTNKNTVSLKNLQPGFHAVKVTKQLVDKEIKTPLMNFTLEFHEPPYFSNPTTQLFIEAETSTREIPLSIDEQEYIQVLRLIKDNITIKESKIDPVLNANDTNTFILKHNFKEEGDYELQLKPQGISYPDYIQTSTLKVVRKDSLNVPEPLKRGKEEVLFQTIDFQKVSLKWTRAYKDSSFEVLINGTVYKTTEPFLDYPLPIRGEQQKVLEWKVREIVNNRKSPYSEPDLIKIQPVENFLQSPASGTRILLEKPNQLVTFEWQGKLKKNEAFEFQVSKSADFKNPFISKKTKEQNAKTPLGAKGEYYWRVKIKTNEGKVRYGSPIKIQVQPAPPPTPIKLKERIE